MQQKINFTRLDDLDKKRSPSVRMWSVGIGVTLLLVVIGTSVYSTSKPFYDFIMFLNFVILLSLGLYEKRLSDKYTEDKVATYHKWASDNNLNYTAKAPGLALGSGGVFIHDGTATVQNVITGNIGALPFTLFHYFGARGRQGLANYVTVMRIELPRVLPHIVIDSHAESVAGSVLPLRFNESQRMELEGDFFHHHSVYAPKGYESLVTNILSPDVMVALSAARCDIEIIDNYMYFYWPFTAKRRSEYEDIFITVEKTVIKMSYKLTKSDIYTSAEHRQLHEEQRRSQGLAVQDETYANLSVTVQVAACLTFIFVIIMSGLPINEAAAAALLWAVLVGALTFAVEALWRYKRANKNLR